MDRASVSRRFPGGPRLTNLVLLSAHRPSRLRPFIDGSNLDIAGDGNSVKFSVVVLGGRRDRIGRGSFLPRYTEAGPVHPRLRGHRSIIRFLGRLQLLLRKC